MNAENQINKLNWLRKSIIGRNIPFETPFGTKPLVYADYTASGRAVDFIENYLQYILQFYANTHTEDDFTGKTMSHLFHEAEKNIKKKVNAGEHGKVIFTGTGATSGITRLQQILGVYWSPATREKIYEFLDSCLDYQKEKNLKCHERLLNYIEQHKPIVFIGPYEHHSNEIMWRQTLCEVIEIPLDKNGELDLIALEKEIADPKYKDRKKIGSFSAASNVTGIKTPVFEVARILHKHDALACFDFAACAPYIEIDMNRDVESYFDAIFFSPHKFLGGPASSGILIINERIYRSDLPPTIAAGGTVRYVNFDKECYIDDIETREKPGTPGIIQAIKSSLVMLLKDKVGIKNIECIEEYYVKSFFESFGHDERVNIYGPTDPAKKIGIVAFNIRHKDRLLHPKFVTQLLNDLFGIQTRAGCSCAGPYGHRLLHVDELHSKMYRCVTGIIKFEGLKPGWVRFNAHYSLSKCEFDYILEAIKFIVEYGNLFLSLYVFDIKTGEWSHINANPAPLNIEFNFNSILEEKPASKMNIPESEWFNSNLMQAEAIVEKLKGISLEVKYLKWDDDIEQCMTFYVVNMKQKK
ncbi:MAG: aminotransferase class V-fold PLP-dependent enzyme [Candidatus Celaenobacter antarcticus]|nr:aminotransferase class V-fold PLP-dependent enzyme [Candidatus Celaenobacter antarcticus]